MKQIDELLHAFFIQLNGGTMNANKRPHVAWLRCARSIGRHYQQARLSCVDEKAEIDFIELVQRLCTLRRQQAIAAGRGWKAAERQVDSDRRRQLLRIRENADAQLKISQSISKFEINETELFRDLLALSQEFAKVKFDAKANRLSVITEDITLDDFRLGAFNIVLHLETLSTSASRRAYYEVIAVDANRASANDDVTHPHVQEDRLCEGDAQPTIKLALQQGRLFDFFQIVEQTLGTYNAASAYVTLQEWNGFQCGRCGYSADPDETRDCYGCDVTICDGCTYRCSDCEESFCGNCDQACGGCTESVCKSCSVACSDCDEQFCSDCLTEDQRCTSCEKKTKEESDEGASETPVHSHSVGEASFPA